MNRVQPFIVPLFALSAVVLSAAAGDLNPPAGPVAPTMKSLQQVEPRTPINSTTTPGDANSLFRIAQPGSYYLTASVAGVASLRGIEVAASDVTIDLNGFTLTGVALSLQGIATDGSRSGIVVKNGSVNSWGSSGIDLVLGGSGAQHRVEGIRASANGNHGIAVAIQSIVRACIASNNAGNGFNAPSFCSFEDCTARFNTARGFGTQSGCNFDRCSALQNTIDGFFIWSDCTLRSCLASGNSGHGIETNDGVTIIASTVVSNGENGLLIDNQCSVVDCIIRNNTGAGIVALDDCSVTRCTITGNGSHGVSCDSGGAIVGNTCTGNGGVGAGAGIHISGEDNRVEENNVATNDWGIQAVGAGNFIARNVASGNTTLNWDVAANNKCLVVIGTNAAAIAGDSGGSSPGSTNPNANYTY